MIKSIASTVSLYPQLEFHANQGEDRVRSSGLKGNLWIKKRYEGFRRQTTGEAASFLGKTIEGLCSDPIGEQKGYKYWYITDHSKVEKIMEALGHR